MLQSCVVSLVNLSRRFSWAVIALTLLLTIGCCVYAAGHFRITTDVNKLLADDLPWRIQEKQLDQDFPQNLDQTVIVIDGETADAAEAATTALYAKLAEDKADFISVVRPDAIPFFRNNGLLYLSQDKLAGALDQLTQAQPILGMMGTDPSLRGFFNVVGLMLQGLAAGATDYARLDQPFNVIADTVEAALTGRDRAVAWHSIGQTEAPTLRDTRKFILTQPVLNYSELEPGAKADNIIRVDARALGLTPDNGVTIRLTGSVPLGDEEFATIANGTSTATIVSCVLVFVLLLLAMRSLKIVIPILLTLAAGLAATTAFALATIGSLNLISVAFAVMFIGIAVDFGIQFGVRYRDQRHQEPDNAKAMSRTAGIIAVPLAMAAGSTALGFFAFIPTSYRGVSELGLIAGAGMIIAFFLNITFLPALLTLVKPPAEAEAIGYRWAGPIDDFIIKYRKAILGIALIAALIGIAAITQLRFDFDPLNLKDRHTESVKTLFDIMKDPDSGFYKAVVLRPSLDDAEKLASQIKQLPEVDHVVTLASFVPDDQDAKLETIRDTRTLLSSTLAMTPTQPAPTDDEIYSTLKNVAMQLHAIEAQHPSAMRLAKDLDAVVATHDHALLERLQKNIVGVLLLQLNMAKQVLGASKITADDITDDLRRDWVTPDGRYLVKVFPKGDAHDEKTLVQFTDAVRKIAPDLAGTAVSIRESGQTVTDAFIHAGIYALIAISLLSFLVLKRIRDVLMLLIPLILAGILTLATMVAIDLPLNFANIISLPLLLSLGVSYAIYFVSYWRSGMTHPLQSSMARAVFFSAATVLVAFGSLALSQHPGTSGMGKLLTVALLYSLTCTFFVLPALLGPHKEDKD